MKKLALVLVLFLTATLLASAAQKRVQQKTAADFPGLIVAVQSSWKAGEYGQCSALLREATALCAVERSRAVRAALPPAPEGYELVVHPAPDTTAKTSLIAETVGSVVTQEYRGPEHLKVAVTADSPLVGLLAMWAANPAMLEEGSELIEYGAHRAVLSSIRGGSGRKLMILINGAHTCQVTYQGSDEEFLFELFDQQTIDALARALGQ